METKTITFMPISSWSFSRLQKYEQCPHRAKLEYVDKLVPPERPLPPGKQEHANERGTRIHQAAEDFVRGTGLMIPELKEFEHEFNALKRLFSEGKVSLEGDWATDRDWNPCSWSDRDKVWQRLKLDACVFLNDYEAIVIDYKGLPLNTPIPTPQGYTTMGEVKVGDVVFDRQGRVCGVTGKSKVKHLPNYRITFDDTSVVECDEEHLWVLHSGEVRQVTELQIGDLMPLAAPLELPAADLPIDPYVLGIWLADGKHTSGEITKPDEFIWQEIQRRGYHLSHDYSERAGDGKCRVHTVLGLRTQLRGMGLLGNKHIPPIYLRASYHQRLALLQGLMDGDGSANVTRKQAVVNTTDEASARQIKELLLTLGQRPLLSPYTATGFGQQVRAYAVSFRPQNLNPFLLPRKASKVALFGKGKSWRRRIVAIENIGVQPSQCIAVDSPDHTFLCTANFLPTHNTGKRFGNEIKHGEQTQLYALNTFLRYPDLESITTELWYTDAKLLESVHYTRDQALRFKRRWDSRADKMTTATEFPTRATVYTCKWCDWKNTEHCDRGV